MKNLAQIDFKALDSIRGQNNSYVNWSSNTSIGIIIGAFLPYVFTIAGMLLLVYLIIGGIQLMVSRGDPKAAGGAKANITNALVGFIIIFIAYWLVQLVGIVLGLQGIGSIFK